MHPVSDQVDRSAFNTDNLLTPEQKEQFGIRSEREIEQMSREELIANYKSAQIVIISEASRNKSLSNDVEGCRREAMIAISRATTVQANANIAENQRNRQDFQTMQSTTTLCTAGRIVSLISTIAVFVITLICIFI